MQLRKTQRYREYVVHLELFILFLFHFSSQLHLSLTRKTLGTNQS